MSKTGRDNGVAKAELTELNETELDTVDGGYNNAWPSKITGPTPKADSIEHGVEASVRRRTTAEFKS